MKKEKNKEADKPRDKKQQNTIFHGDSLDVLKTFESNSVDLLCTDPPYGYGFMGKSWDKTLPDIGIFKECLRVLKPGSFAFVMSAPRSDVCSRTMLMLEDAGFEIGFTPIYWTYASGFPKAMNIGKMVDKKNGHNRNDTKHSRFVPFGSGSPRCLTCKKTKGSEAGNCRCVDVKSTALSPQAKALNGSYGGFQPKPAVEVVIVAMKPLSEKTFVDQALKNGKGITWLDECRIPTTELTPRNNSDDSATWGTYGNGYAKPHENGRFPANLLVSDDVLNDGTIHKTGAMKGTYQGAGRHGIYGKFNEFTAEVKVDSGSYSRYFDLDAWAKTFPFLIVPKASKKEKNEGLEGIDEKEIAHNTGNNHNVAALGRETKHKNNHPTVKPLKLMSYLITIGSREGDVVLDPFLGSGTTALAAKNLDRKYIGIERESEYVEIANARIAACLPESLFDTK